ncbi:MAG: ABC transporter substrate-binding protein [Bacteroidota bacterium]
MSFVLNSAFYNTIHFMMNPKHLLLSLILGILLLVSCRNASNSSGPYLEKNGQIIYSGPLGPEVVMHMISEPKSLHPTNSTVSQKDEVMTLVYQRLLDIDCETGKLVPVLVEALPIVSEDGLTFTFTLREEAKWVDGSSITAKDVLFSFKLFFVDAIENGDLKNYAEYIAEFNLYPDNPRKFDLVMSETYMLNDYIGNLTMILNPGFYDPQGIMEKFSMKALKEDQKLQENEELLAFAEEFNSTKFGNQVAGFMGGSGPYIIKEWLPEQQIVLVKREDYWGQGLVGNQFAAYPPSVTFRTIKDEQATVEAIRQQAVDGSAKISPAVFEQILNDSIVNAHYKVQKQSRSTGVMLVLNNQPDGVTQSSIFDDKRVRQAAQFALPMDEILNERLETDFIRANSPVPPGNPHYDPSLVPFAHDPHKAAKLLDEAGWIDRDGDGIREKEVNGQRVDLSFSFDYPPQNITVKSMADEFQKEWKKVGFDVKLAPGSMRAYLGRLSSGQFDMALLALTPPPTLPYDYKSFFHSDNYPEGSNFFGFVNAEADSLIDLLRVTVDGDKRQELAFKVNRILAEEVPALFLYHPSKKLVLHKRFSGGDIYQIPPYLLPERFNLIRAEN